MRVGRILAVAVVSCLSSVSALVAQAETPLEGTVQYALENLTSGRSTAALIDGTQITVMPTRTWKSVTGHYCRRYEITITEPGANPDHGEWTRCRDGDGVWQMVKEN